MNKFEDQLQDKLNTDHGFGIDYVFQLAAKLAFKKKGQKRKAIAIINDDQPKSDEINALQKAREFTTILNHSTQLFEKL
jgi:hypothetical protein